MSVEVLIKRRTYARQRVTRIYNAVESDLERLSEQDRLIHIDRLSQLKKELLDLDDVILRDVVEKEDDSVIQRKINDDEDYQHKIVTAMLKLQKVQATHSGFGSTPNPSVNIKNALKMPQVPLPEYDNTKGQCLVKFFYEFEKLTDKQNWSDHLKFMYLRNQLSKSPRALVDSLDVGDQSYGEAKQLLLKAFAMPLMQKYDAIKKLTELNLPPAGDPYAFVASMRTAKNAFNKLKVTVDDILQYFIWNGLNEQFQAILTQITNVSRPSLDEIENNIFEASERYQRLSEGKSSSKENAKEQNVNKEKAKEKGSVASTTLATKVNVSPKFRACLLCTNDGQQNVSHSINSCSVYPDSKRKVERLKELNACSRCGYPNHVTRNCKFRFTQRCRTCSGWHFTYLCIGKEKPSSSNNKDLVSSNSRTSEANTPGNKNKADTKQTTNSLTLAEIHQNVTGGVAILPTFTCDVARDGYKVRVLRDGGSQRNFICFRYVEKLGLPVSVKNISMAIHGFNSTREIVTDIVSVPVKIGSEWHNIEAVVVPSISINLKLDGLDVIVKSFIDKHYTLADEFLGQATNTVGNIGIILGNDSDYLLEVTTRKFGSGTPSIYLDTPLGVMLSGSIDRIISNLDALPRLSPKDNFHTLLSSLDHGSSPMVDEEDEISPFSKGLYLRTVSASILADEDSDLIKSKVPLNEMQGTTLNVAYDILNEKGKLKKAELNKATEEMLEEHCLDFLDCDRVTITEDETETNKKLVKYVLDNTERDDDGRLIMPLMWNHKISHLLGKNFNLSRMILKSNLSKLKNKSEQVQMIDDVFREQQQLGIIERIDDIYSFMNDHPEASFLPHMPVFRLDRDTTKCRVVFLSNLCEREKSRPNTYSHNQAMLPGPCLNHKITTSLIMQRFDSHLVCFDIKKAFLMIGLKEEDQNRLVFLWYRNVQQGDYTIVGFRNKRLSFGLRPSPCHLMLALFKILMLDVENDSEELAKLKQLIYNNIYMDNGSYSCNSHEELLRAYQCIPAIFKPYKFELQQFITNDDALQTTIDTSENCQTPREVKLLGIMWDRNLDTFSPGKIQVNAQANTKRSILSTLNSIYDVFNIYGPILNRARLFLKRLHENKSVTWDSSLSEPLQKEWKLIVKQINSTPTVAVPRFIGRRDSSYALVAFSDASKDIYGTVIYIIDVNTCEASFLMAKSRVVNKQLEKKTIPMLEFQALGLAAENLINLYQELSGPSVVSPLSIESLQVYSDSMVALNWLYSYAYNFDKMQKKGVFILNRLRAIIDLCQMVPVRFSFVSAYDNPADHISRCVSYRQLQKSNYYSGPEFIKNLSQDDSNFSFVIPNPLAKLTDEVPEVTRNEYSTLATVSMRTDSPETQVTDVLEAGHLISLERFSSFHKLATVHRFVLKFIRNIKNKLISKGINTSWGKCIGESNLYSLACKQIISREQTNCFPDVCQFFEQNNVPKRDIPNLVTQMNLFRDSDAILRVRSKFARKEDQNYFPILLSKNSLLTKLIIRDMHVRLGHAGVYMLLGQLRKQFWIIHYYSTVRRVLRECVTCRQLNERPINYNQSSYRDYRTNPPAVPFRYAFMDYIGPYTIQWNGERKKAWLLIVTCLWSRAINLKVCLSADTKDFLRALQLHIFEFGIPEFCVSDLGSQLTAGSRVIETFLSDYETHAYFEEHNIKPLKFEQYAKGNSSLGSLVESCVKMVKKLIFSSIRNSVLDYQDFHFLICQAVHLINKRPVAFKDGLRDTSIDNVEDPITPECLLKGYDLVSVNIIPDLQKSPEDPDYLPGGNVENVRDNYFKLRQARNRLNEIYHSEFLANLISQAIDKKDRYRAVNHKLLNVGDIVLLKEDSCKQSAYPIGIVKKIELNHLGEVKAARVLKGKSREIVYRTVDSLILLLPKEGFNTVADEDFHSDSVPVPADLVGRSSRAAAVESQKRTNLLFQEGLV